MRNEKYEEHPIKAYGISNKRKMFQNNEMKNMFDEIL